MKDNCYSENMNETMLRDFFFSGLFFIHLPQSHFSTMALYSVRIRWREQDSPFLTSLKNVLHLLNRVIRKKKSFLLLLIEQDLPLDVATSTAIKVVTKLLISIKLGLGSPLISLWRLVYAVPGIVHSDSIIVSLKIPPSVLLSAHFCLNKVIAKPPWRTM